MTLVPTVIVSLKSMDLPVQGSGTGEGMSSLLNMVMNSIKNHYRPYTVTDFGIVLAMLYWVSITRSIDTSPVGRRPTGSQRHKVRRSQFG